MTTSEATTPRHMLAQRRWLLEPLSHGPLLAEVTPIEIAISTRLTGFDFVCACMCEQQSRAISSNLAPGAFMNKSLAPSISKRRAPPELHALTTLILPSK